jgi:hypothetical protein
LVGGGTLPPPQKLGDEDPYFFAYNATCMFEERESLVKALNSNRTGLTRPGPEVLGAPSNTAAFIQSLDMNFKFFKAQWSGEVPIGYDVDVPWRKTGFVELDSETCKEQEYKTSFATGGMLCLVATLSVGVWRGHVLLTAG